MSEQNLQSCLKLRNSQNPFCHILETLNKNYEKNNWNDMFIQFRFIVSQSLYHSKFFFHNFYILLPICEKKDFENFLILSMIVSFALTLLSRGSSSWLTTRLKI